MTLPNINQTTKEFLVRHWKVFVYKNVFRPVVRWLKNGEILSSSDNDRIRMTKSGSLVFNEVRKSDSGEYVCQVSISL